jgi:starvation-inducible DNA-binding protein
MEPGLAGLEALARPRRNHRRQPLATLRQPGEPQGKEMNKSDHNHVLHPTRLDMPPEICAYLIQLLNQTLACTVDLRSHVKQAGWNVRGPDFSALQALFATMASELDAYADLVAERIAVLGGVARGTAHTAAMQSTLPEYPGALVDGHAHVLVLAERFGPYATAMRGGITLAVDVEDAGSAAVYTEISHGVDKRLWVLDAHLNRCEGPGQHPRVALEGGKRARGVAWPQQT